MANTIWKQGVWNGGDTGYHIIGLAKDNNIVRIYEDNNLLAGIQDNSVTDVCEITVGVWVYGY